MKVVILAGGYGTRISEESHLRPKPMIEIGGRPMLWHIMKIYASHGVTDFIICCGYRGYLIKEYFANYYLHVSDVTFDLGKNRLDILQNSAEPWRVTLVDTGDTTATGGRLRRVRHLLGAAPFCFTYGDGVSNVDIAAPRRSRSSASHVSRRNRSATRDGSMAASSTSHPRSWITSTVIPAPGNASRWSGSLPTAN